MKQKLFSTIMSLSFLFLIANTHKAQADTIYVISSVFNPTSATQTTNNLANLGHNVTNGGSTTLSDYSSFDQVWDMRFEIAISSSDETAYLNYLNQGGNLLLLGEKNVSEFSARRNSMVNFISSAGGGSISLDSGGPIDEKTTQAVTTEGQTVISNMSSIVVHNYGLITNPGNGFLVTQRNPGEGTVAAWDFGDLTSGARLIAAMDSNILSNSGDGTPENNGEILVENFANFLSANAVPEPSSFFLFTIGLLFCLGYTKKNK